MRRLGASVTAALLAAGSLVVPMGGGPTAHAAVPPSFVAPSGGTISGQVTDDRGAPLSAVSVQIVGSGSRQVQTGADGRYSASSLPDGSYRVSVDTGHPNPVNNTSYSAYPELIDVTATTGQTGVDFELPRPAIVTGTVRNEGGTPVGNAVVLGLNGYYMPVAGDGQYLGTTTAGTHTLGVGAPGYVGWSVSPGFFYTQADVTTTVGQRTSVDVTLDAGGSISGHLMGSDGMPAMGAFVSASQINPVGVGSYGTTTTDQTGFYEIKALLAGDYSVVATSSATSAAGAVYYPGTPDWKAAAPVTVIDAAVTPSIDFALPAPVPLGPPITVASMSPMIFYRGTTTTATITGTGFVAGSNLRIDRWGPGSPPEISVVQVVDSEHVLVSVSVPADAWLNGEGGIYVMQLGQFAELQGVPFVADAGSSFGTISGRVTRASDGTPVANVRVAAESLNGPAPFDPATVTRADGTYVLGPLPPGEYAVRFSPGWPTYDLAAEFYPDAKTDLTKAAVSVSGDADTPGIDAVLEPATTGVVTGASPSVLQPGSTTDVTLTGTGFGIDDHVYVSGATYESWAPRVVSEQLVSSTEVHVQVEVGALSPSMQLSVNTPPHGGGFVSQCFCLSIAATPPSTGLLAGSIVDPVGDGLRSIRVSATLDGQTAPTTTVWTGQDGTYALRLPAGAYTIHSQDLAGAIVDSGPITVGVGDTVQAGTTTWAVPAAIGTLSGTVTDASNGVVIDGALVEATNVSTHEATAVLSHGGVYQFPTLPAGDYTLEFAHPGYQSRWYNGATSSAAATSVTVVAGSVTSAVDQGLPLSRRSLSVSALQPNRVAQGESISNVVISGAGFVLGDVTNLSFSAGDGVSIAGVTTVDDTTATVSVVVAPNATIGPHDVIAMRDDGQQATCTGCLRVFAGLASIGGTVALSDGRSSVINVSVVSQTTGETFRVGAAPGPWTIDRLPADTYRVGFSTYGYVDQWYDNVDAPAAATPVVVGTGPVVGINATMAVARKYLSLWGISPFVIQQGSQTAVTITGQGFLDGGVTGLTIDAGVGVTVQGINVLSDSSATATLTVAVDAGLGVRPLKGSRDDGTTSTCFACLNIVPAAGHISGRVTGTNGLAFGSVDAFRVGDLSPSTAVVRPDGTYSFDQLQAGDYQLRFNGYGTNYVFAYTTEWWNDASTQAAATTISIAAGQTVSGIDAQLSVSSSPLSLAQYFASYDAYQGMTRTVSLFGTGFLNGVTGLAFSAGPGISIVAGTISSDTVANVTITADPGAALGLRDITVTRGDGQTATCTQCLDVVTPPPGNVVATVLDVDTGASVYGAATISPVGDPTPVWSSPVYGSLYAYGLAAGEYDLTIDAAYYTPFTTRVTVVTGQTTYLPVVYMRTIRQPLTFNSPSSLPVYQGYPAQFYVTGTGFRFGGVTGLTFSAGADVAVDISAILSDGAAWITVTASAGAQTGSRDLTISRDDGQTVTCIGCLVVSAPAAGSLSGTVVSSDSYSYLSATVTITPVGGTTPVAVVPVVGSFDVPDLAPGQYNALFESPGYESSTQLVTIVPGQTTYAYVYLLLPRQPLTISSVTPSTVYRGAYYSYLRVSGSGFRAGGVSGLNVSLGPDVSVYGVYVNTDSSIDISYSIPSDAAIGPRDVTISRDVGETATCAGCIAVDEAPGYVSGYIGGPTCCSNLSATITATRVGEATPTTTADVAGYYSLQLPPGDYILKVEAAGYLTQWWYASSTEAGAIPLAVPSNSYVSSVDFYLVPPRQPLTITGLSWSDLYQQQGTYLWVYGTGFLYGDVAGLTFSSTNQVTVSLDTVYSDTEALVVVTAAVAATPGPRDLSVTRDDGQTATCSACLTVHRGDPYVESVTPSVVREGTRTLTIQGPFMQRVTRVTTSSRKVKVKSFKNNADGSVTVRVVIDGGARKTYTLTFTRDDGVTFAADFSVRG